MPHATITRKQFWLAVLPLLLFVGLFYYLQLSGILLIDSTGLFELVAFPTLLLTLISLVILIRREVDASTESLFWRAFLGVVALALIAHSLGISSRSIWLDEDEFIGDIWGYTGRGFSHGMKSMVEVAALSGQSPLSYYFTYFFTKIFGIHPWSARLCSVLMGSLSAGLFFLILFGLVRRVTPCVLGTIVFIFDPYLHYYFQEARPYSVGVLMTCAFILTTFFFRKTLSIWSLWALFGSTLLVLFSLGLQAPPLVGAFGLILLVRLRHSKLHILGLLATCAPAIFIFLPYQWYSIGQAKETYIQKLLIQHNWQTTVQDMYVAVGRLLSWQFFPVVIVLLFYSLYLFRMYRTNHSSRLERIASDLLFVIASLWIFVLAAFCLVINWQLLDRYFLFALVNFHILFFVAAVKARKIFTWLRIPPLSLLWIAVGFSLTVAPFCYGQLAIPYQGSKGRSFRIHWKKLYEYVEKYSSPKDQYLLLDIKPPSTWTPENFIATQIYYPRKNQRNKAKIHSLWEHYHGSWTPDQILRAVRTTGEIDNFVFVFPTMNYDWPELQLLSRFVEHISQNQPTIDPSIRIVIVPAGTNPPLTMINFLHEIKNNMGRGRQSYQITMALAVLGIETGDFTLIQECITELESYGDKIPKDFVQSIKDQFISLQRRGS